MSTPQPNSPFQFVYAKFRDQVAADKAVSALVGASIEPDEIDLVAEHLDGTERVTMLHEQPILKGAFQGLILGLLAGVILSTVFSDDGAQQPMLAALRWVSSAAMLGTIVGAIAGMGMWRARSEVSGGTAIAQTFLVGTSVGPARVPQIEELLQSCNPIDVGHRAMRDGEAQHRRKQRDIEPAV